MKDRGSRGGYGYRDYRRKMRTVMIAADVTAILIRLATRGLTNNQAAKNIPTVTAVPSVLFTTNLVSPLLISWRYRTPSEAFYQKMRAHKGEFTILHDLVTTTKENILPFDAMIVYPNGIYTCCTANKVDNSKVEKSLNILLRGQKLDRNLKIIKGEKGFFHRMEGLKPVADYEDDGNVDYTASFLKSMSM